jgi:hypothetical protein
VSEQSPGPPPLARARVCHQTTRGQSYGNHGKPPGRCLAFDHPRSTAKSASSSQAEGKLIGVRRKLYKREAGETTAPVRCFAIESGRIASTFSGDGKDQIGKLRTWVTLPIPWRHQEWQDRDMETVFREGLTSPPTVLIVDGDVDWVGRWRP